MTTGRDERGFFIKGNKIATGRPPRNYSISHAISLAAELPQSVDNEGNQLTDAQLAARWLWEVVRTGIDTRKNPDGKGELHVPVCTRDRLAALATILNRIEPEWKSKIPIQPHDDDAEPLEKEMAKLTDQELNTVLGILTGRSGGGDTGGAIGTGIEKPA